MIIDNAHARRVRDHRHNSNEFIPPECTYGRKFTVATELPILNHNLQVLKYRKQLFLHGFWKRLYEDGKKGLRKNLRRYFISDIAHALYSNDTTNNHLEIIFSEELRMDLYLLIPITLFHIDKIESLYISNVYRIKFRIDSQNTAIFGKPTLKKIRLDHICRVEFEGIYESITHLCIQSSILQFAHLDFRGLPQLKRLEIMSSQLEHFPQLNYQNCKLENIDMSKNQLNHFPEDIFRIKSLKLLILNSNNLVILPDFTFRNTTEYALLTVLLNTNMIAYFPHYCAEGYDKYHLHLHTQFEDSFYLKNIRARVPSNINIAAFFDPTTWFQTLWHLIEKDETIPFDLMNHPLFFNHGYRDLLERFAKANHYSKPFLFTQHTAMLQIELKTGHRRWNNETTQYIIL